MEQLEQNRDAVQVEITDKKRAQFDGTSLSGLVIVLSGLWAAFVYW